MTKILTVYRLINPCVSNLGGDSVYKLIIFFNVTEMYREGI